MWRDDAYLLDVLIAARKVVSYTQGVTREEFERNDLLQNAVMRMLEIIGEAARRVSDDMRDAHPEVPWREMISLRNRLIHEYFRIDVEKVWDTAVNDVPALISVVESLVPRERDNEAR
jgi:uncharacterized protein with HEPN domain